MIITLELAGTKKDYDVEPKQIINDFLKIVLKNDYYLEQTGSFLYSQRQIRYLSVFNSFLEEMIYNGDLLKLGG